MTGGAASIECEPGSIAHLIEQVDARHTGFRERVTQDGALRRFVNAFVEGEDVRFAEGIDTEVADGQEVTILPAVAGG
jgi:molybdopterin converting factor small subunit